MDPEPEIGGSEGADVHDTVERNQRTTANEQDPRTRRPAPNVPVQTVPFDNSQLEAMSVATQPVWVSPVLGSIGMGLRLG